jgi:cell division septal protein FtsQ
MAQTTKMDERYGRRGSKLRPSTIVLASALLLGFLVFAIYSSFIAKPLASVEVTSYQQVDANHILGNYTALTGPEGASCRFKASAARGNVVGFVEVQIPANNSDKKALQVIVKTLEPASVLRADGCRVK